jgi:hypothetical protein
MGIPVDDASCVYIPQFLDMPADQLAATIANIIIAVISILSLAYYGVHSYFSACGWEEVYVCIVERECGGSSSCGCCQQCSCTANP